MAKTDGTGPMKPYTAKKPIRHDHENYAIGGTIALTDAQAAPLLAQKAVEAATATPAKADPSKTEK